MPYVDDALFAHRIDLFGTATTGWVVAFDGSDWVPTAPGAGSTDPETVRDVIGAALVEGTAIDVVVSDVGDTITLNVVMGTGSGTACVGNDARLSNSRAPTAHASTHNPGGADALATGTPVGLGVSAAEGSASSLARSDHVHPSSPAVVYDVDFSTLSTNTLTDGTEVVDGLSWTQASLALLGVAAITNGSGMVLDVGNSVGSNSTFTSTAQSTYHIYLPLSALANLDPRKDVVIEVYLSGITTENSGEGFFVGLWGPANVPITGSASRVRWAGLFNSAGSRVLRSTSQTTATSTSDTRTTHDVIGMRLTPHGVGHTWSGVYSGGFPTAVPGTCFPTLGGAADPFTAAGVRLVFGVATVNDASATSIYTVRRLRVSQ